MILVLLYGFLFATLMAALFHLWRDGGLGKLISICLPVGQVSGWGTWQRMRWAFISWISANSILAPRCWAP